MVELDERPPFRKRRPCACCCLVLLAFIVVLGIIILILALTVFKTKKAEISVDDVRLIGFSAKLGQSGVLPTPTVNLTLAVVVSLHNPNKASLKYADSTAMAYYYDDQVAVVPIPAGRVGSDSTENISTTLVVFADQLATNSHLVTDVLAGSMPMTTLTHLSARVKVLFVKHHIDITSRCSVTIFVSNASVGNIDCQNKVHL